MRNRGRIFALQCRGAPTLRAKSHNFARPAAQSVAESSMYDLIGMAQNLWSIAPREAV
jgi:hypothetical protein